MRFPERLDRLASGVERIAGLLLALITILVFVSAILRYGFAAPIPDSFDLARLLLGVVIFWGFASVGYRGAHIKVDLVAGWLPARLQRWLDLLGALVLLLFTVLLAWKLGERVESAFASHEATMDLRLPVWPWLALIWLGVIASVLTISARVFFTLRSREDDRTGAP